MTSCRRDDDHHRSTVPVVLVVVCIYRTSDAQSTGYRGPPDIHDSPTSDCFGNPRYLLGHDVKRKHKKYNPTGFKSVRAHRGQVAGEIFLNCRYQYIATDRTTPITEPT